MSLRRALGLLLLMLLLAYPIAEAGDASWRSYIYSVTYTVENRGSQPYRMSMRDRSIPLFWSSKYQRVRLLNSTHRVVRSYIDEDGNPLALLDLPKEISPGSSITYSGTYIIELAERPRLRIDPEMAGGLEDIPGELVEEFTLPTETFTIDEVIEELATSITANESTVLGMVLALLDWVRENIEYGSLEFPRYPLETLRGRVGDCDDQAILLITLSRALGIPALLQLGNVYMKRYERSRVTWEGRLELRQRDVGWHGWALIYIPPWGWLPIDLTLKVGPDPLSYLVEAPQHEGFIAVCYNISRSDYVGESRGEREWILSNNLHITVEERMIPREAPTRRRTNLIAISAAIIAATLLLFALRRLIERGF